MIFFRNNGRNFRKISDDQDLVNDTDDKDDKESDNSLGVAIPIASPKIDNELDVIVAPPPAKDTKLVNGFVIAFHQDLSTPVQ